MAQAEISASDDFAARLSLALKACNLSRAQLASTLGVNKSLVSRWLSGEMNPTGYNLARISTLFAKLKPGFNMTLWDAPMPAFEAALGLGAATRSGNQPSEDSFTPESAPANAAAADRNFHSARTRRQTHLTYPVVAGAIIVALIVLALFAWQSWFGVSSTKNRYATLRAPSVAVMPFVNMSGDPSKEYLGDGISEEILNDLANTPNLRVASRTSAFWFKGRSADIPEIAHRLNVGAVLEGSVREEGRRIRIVAQLIDASNGFHLWSASYDRNIDTILAVQDEIARAIVAALSNKLNPKSVAAAAHSLQLQKRIDPDAYEAYLQGLFSMNKSGAGDLLQAVALFKRAIDIEPDYLDARARLAWTYTVLLVNGERRDTLGPAQAQIAAVLERDPGNFSALLADAVVKQFLWKWNDADAESEELLRQHPGNAQVHFLRAGFFEDIGLWEKAVAEHRRAAELDPLVPAYRDTLGQALHFLGRDDEAYAEFKQVLKAEPNFVLSLGNICQHYADAGNVQEAKKILYDKLIPLYGDDPNRLLCASIIAYREHDRPGLQKIAHSMEQRYDQGTLAAAWVPYPYAFMGDYDTAMQWMEKAYDDHDLNILYVMADPDVPTELKNSLRWREFVRRPAFQEIAHERAQILARDG